MTEKLVKTGNDYILYSKDKTVLGITSGTMEGRMLSLKNCDSIANGYDLIKLVEENSKYSEEDWGDGFLFAMNLMSNKKFSETELYRAFLINSAGNNTTLENTFKETVLPMFIDNEWDVEIEMEDTFIKNSDQYIDEVGVGNYSTHSKKPKLDADGCLILRRI